MTNAHSEDRTFAQAASAIGMSPSRFSHAMKAKGFRGRKGIGNVRLVNREELAALGNSVTDEAWHACRSVTAQSGKTEQRRRAANRAASVPLPPFDLGLLHAAFEARDREWQRQLLARGLDVQAPPMPEALLPQLAGQNLFSRSAVALLMQQHQARRDRDWEAWITDPEHRALHPNGPPAIGSDAFFQDNLTGDSHVDHR